jgi:hypothetical protein
MTEIRTLLDLHDSEDIFDCKDFFGPASSLYDDGDVVRVTKTARRSTRLPTAMLQSSKTDTKTLRCLQASMLSPQGRCQAFDVAADGYVRGEGVAVILLQPLTPDQPPAAIMRGSAVNQDGRCEELFSFLSRWNSRGIAALICLV